MQRRASMERLVLVAVALTLVACSKDAEKTRPGPFAELAPSAAPVTLLSGAPPPRPPFEARMKDHALRGIAIRDAVVRGDVGLARDGARALAELPIATEPDADRRHLLDAMNAALRETSDARDTTEAAARVARVASTCGRCHAASVGPRPSDAPPPPSTSTPAERMARHQWAAARLWEGLAAPSDEAWDRGAYMLLDAPLGTLPDGGTPELLARVHDLGQEALRARTTTERVRVYGALLARCGTCHEQIGGGPR